MHRALRYRLRVGGIPQSDEVVTPHLEIGNERNRPLVDPAISVPVWQFSPVPSPYGHAGCLGELFTQPSPKPVPHVVVDLREHRLGAVAVLVEAPPTEQKRVEVVNHLLKGQALASQGGPLLDAVADVLDPVLGDFDPGPVAPAVVPAQSDPVSEEREPLGERGDPGLLR